MQPLLDQLLDCERHRKGERPAAPERPGVYLITEDDKPIYVGQTRNFRRRWGEHSRPSSPENSALFAFNIAKQEAARKKLTLTGSRKAVSASPDFGTLFLAAKQRVRAMDFRFVEIDDAPLRTIFEVYASLALGTHGEFNLFETH
jgi:GIY-YIG catalytic domain